MHLVSQMYRTHLSQLCKQSSRDVSAGYGVSSKDRGSLRMFIVNMTIYH